jgi:Cdc6-like AAA superfamily ATPase
LSNNIKNSFDQAEKVGVVGSPSSSHSLTLDILGTAVDKKLVGTLCMLNFRQDSNDNYALGQITEISLRNVWSEDPTMRGLIRQRGRVDPITERQDTHTATMLVSSVFGKNQAGFEPSMLGTVPSTGTPIRLVNEQFMRDLLSEYSNELIYMGKAYGSTVLLPMWLKHFGQGDGGIGEAYHIGIFGKTGSGKSVLSKMVMMGYAKHKPMSIFVLDPQGEFAKIKDDSKMREMLEKLGKELKVYNLHNLVLTGNDLFKKILTSSRFFDKLGIFHDDNKARAADQIDLILQGRHSLFPGQLVKPWHFYKKETFDKIWSALADDRVLSNIYTSKELQDRVRSAVQAANSEYVYNSWAGVARLFTFEGREKDAVKIIDLTRKVTEQAEGQIVIIDLADINVPANTLWNDDIRMIVINEFLESLSFEAQSTYKQGRLLNTLVIIDEAHRLAPRDWQQNDQLEKIKATLKDAVRTTRKFGLGWMFVSQTLSGLDRELINQMRIYFFGFGLSYGIELLGLREIIGGNDEAIRLYQLFKDPQSNPKQKEYSFMTIGPASPLSFSGIPLFFEALQYPDAFIKENLQFFNQS